MWQRDTRRTPNSSRDLRESWARTGIQRLGADRAQRLAPALGLLRGSKACRDGFRLWRWCWRLAAVKMAEARASRSNNTPTHHPAHVTTFQIRLQTRRLRLRCAAIRMAAAINTST